MLGPVRQSLPLISLIFALGCDRLDGDGVFIVDACEDQNPRGLHPLGGETNAWSGGLIWAEITCADEDAVLSLGRAGNPVDGVIQNTHSGFQVTFAPNAALQRGVIYDARLDTNDSFIQWQFAVSDLGETLETELSERALALLPEQAGVLEPAGFRDELPRLLGLAVHPLAQFQTEPSGGEIAMRLGARLDQAVDTQQDATVAAQDLNASWDEPSWSAGPLDMEFPGDGFAMRFEDLRIHNVVGPGLAWGGGGAITALWDFRPAQDALGADFEDPCGTVVAAGGEGCVPCDDGATACLEIVLRDAPALAWGGLIQAP